MSNLFKNDSTKNTSALKNLIKKRRSNAMALNANMQGIERKNHQLGQLITQITTIFENEHKNTIHWNEELKMCKDRILKGSKKSINSKQKNEILDLIKKCDEKMDCIYRAMNQTLNHFIRERKQYETRKSEVEKLKSSLSEFVDETIEELNNITLEVRSVRYTKSNKEEPAIKKRKKEDSLKGYKVPTKIESKKEEPVLVTSLFKLYNNKNAEPKKRTKKRKKVDKTK